MLKQFTGNTEGIHTVSWNWLADDKSLPESDVPIVYSGAVYTVDNDVATYSSSEVPVKRMVMTTSSGEQRMAGKIIERISLILYQFNEYNLSPENMEILKGIFPRIIPEADVLVAGHTDVIGTDEANITLSTNRARVVHETLKDNRPAKSYKYEGLGKNKPLYGNSSPEGRFYNRTVQVIIERETD
jgi:outer membrane protein OmpA-like peptidoglycan-associated protein